MNTGGFFQEYTADKTKNWVKYNATDPNNYPITDWTDLILKSSAPRMTHTLSVSGGNKAVKSVATLSYDEVDGLYDGRGFQRYMFRSNNDFTISDKLSAQNKIKYTYDDAGNRLTRKKEIVVQTRGALNNGEEPSVYEEELSETKVTIYPNPTKGMLKVDISGVEQFENAQISLYDLTGKLLQQWAGISQSNTIDLSERTPGMYIMQVAYNGKISSWKIIKE